MLLRRTLRTGMAAVCAASLVAAPLLAPTTTASAVRAEAAMQSITVKVTKLGITVRGARGLDAGRVKMTVRGRGTAEIMMFDRGYDIRDFKKDLGAFERRNDMSALKRALANTTVLGGLHSGSTGTITLPKAGRYTVFAFASKGHAVIRAGAARRSLMPDVDAKIVARSGPKWGGSTQLPAKGTLLFKNADRTVPHFLLLQQVEEGTTKEQVMEALQSEEGPPPSFILPAFYETGSLSPGRKMTANYDLPPGQYVVLCFFPDPNMKGMPHALMGMVKMIHLM